MEASSIAEPTAKDLASPPDDVLAKATHELNLKLEKGLSIVDSARRDLEATLQLLADRAQYITGASGAAIALRDGDRILCRASSGSAAPELGSYLDLSGGLSGECVRTRTAVRCDNAATDVRVDRESCRRLGIASFAVMPILRDGDAVGIFEVFSSKPHSFQERDLTALERLREMVNVALEHASPDHAKTAPFAVHGTKVKVMAAIAGVGGSATVASREDIGQGGEKSGFVSGLPGSHNSPETSLLSDRVRSCKQCGFPISEGRIVCLDCEAKGISSANAGFLSNQHSRGPKGIKSWIITNRYIIGMVLISAATIAFALLR